MWSTHIPNQLARRPVLLVNAIQADMTSARQAAAIHASGSESTSPPTTAITANSAGTITIGDDLNVNRLGLGAMRITGPNIWGDPADVPAAHRLLRRAVELKITLIDTADAYGPEVSERLIYEALHPYPKGLVIATKGGCTRPGPQQWGRAASPQQLRAACEASLQRLHLERIDLYQLHALDPNVPLQESIGELARLQAEGKIRHIGVSNFKLAQLQQAGKLVKIVSVQNRYNLNDRSADEMLEYCTQNGIAFLPWGPLSGHERLAQLATSRGITTTQAALAWLLARSPMMLPIPGTASPVHLEENVAAAAITLSSDELKQIA